MRRFPALPVLLLAVVSATTTYAADSMPTTTAERDAQAPNGAGGPLSADVERGITAPKADGAAKNARDTKPNGVAHVEQRKL